MKDEFSTSGVLRLAAAAGLAVGAFTAPGNAQAATNCTFTNSGTVMRLNGSCTTDGTLLVPNGFTLDGRGFTITAVDPPGGGFLGAIV